MKKVTLSIRLNNTGLNSLNRMTFEQEHIISDEALNKVVRDVPKFEGCREDLSYVDWLANGFKEDISQEVNEALLDTCKGHTYSIAKHGAFCSWLENQNIDIKIEDR